MADRRTVANNRAVDAVRRVASMSRVPPAGGSGPRDVSAGSCFRRVACRGNWMERSPVRSMDALNRLTALVLAAEAAHGRALIGWKQALVLATLLAVAASALVFLAS